MPGLNISAFETHTRAAIRHFWTSRQDAASRQKARGVQDQGNRGGVTSGKNMDGFIDMVRKLIIDNGVPDVEVFTEGRSELTLPGFFRPTKNWDLLVVSRSQLIAAVEFKSQVGPSFGNNFNNRVEEALGNATDLRTAFREGVFGKSARPFIGFFFVLEDCLESKYPVGFMSPHFPSMPEFARSSYAKRYEILCRKLVLEELYDAAALLLTKKTDEESGAFTEMSSDTNCLRFATTLAGKVAAIATERSHS